MHLPAAHVRAGWPGVAQEHRLQVHRDGLVELRLGQVIDPADQGDTGVVDEYVDLAEARLHLRDHPGDGGAVRDVGGNRQCTPSLATNRFAHLLGLDRTAAVVDGDVGTGIRQRQRDGGADAARPAGDERDAVLQREVVGHGGCLRVGADHPA